jgi:hypothetical protein
MSPGMIRNGMSHMMTGRVGGDEADKDTVRLVQVSVVAPGTHPTLQASKDRLD